jgi:serine/threonine protein kinase
MFQSAKMSLARFLARWCPETFVSRKMNQAEEFKNCPYSSDRLSGTMATCDVLGNVLKKRLRNEFLETDKRDLFLISLLVSSAAIKQWAVDSARLEGDFLNEAHMQSLFANAWRHSLYVYIPEVYNEQSNRHVIAMAYVPWPRLGEHKQPSKAVEMVARFFFRSISEFHLLHGDISVTNVLVDPDDDGRVAILDFGLSRVLSGVEAVDLLRVRRNSTTSVLLLGAWSQNGFTFSEDLWSDVIWPAVSAGSEDKEATSDGTFVRSLVSLTRMACQTGITVHQDVASMVFLD